jgi:hopanoid-associated phosphorylase
VSADALDRHIVAVSGMTIEARIAAGTGVRCVVSAGDAVGLERALQHEHARGLAGVISFGIAAGLVADAAPGTWIIADAVVTSDVRLSTDARWSSAIAARLPAARRGDIAGVDTPVALPQHKRALGARSGAIAVDMESHVAAAFAAARGLPFAVFRVVADPVMRAVAPAALHGLRTDGTVNQRAVLTSLARRPGQLPTLLRNALDTKIALGALLRGRRLLGAGLAYPNLGKFLVDVT